MRARASLLAALAVFTIASAGLAAGGAEAQPYGRAQGFRVAEHGRGRGQERREERREDRRGGPPGQQYRQEYRPPAYDRGPSRGAYAYPAPREPYARLRDYSDATLGSLGTTARRLLAAWRASGGEDASGEVGGPSVWGAGRRQR